MKTSSDRAAVNGAQGSAGKIDRREMVRRLMLGAGAGMALPGAAVARPLPRQGSDSPGSGEANDVPAWPPPFLDPHQKETLAVLAERIVPGSGEAKVGDFVELLVSVDSQEVQREFLSSLAAFETKALREHSRPFKNLTVGEQNRMIAASTEKSGMAEGDAGDLAAAGTPTMRDHFENLKGWIADAYYSSEVGMKDLGWTGQVAFASFPGCQEPGKHS